MKDYEVTWVLTKIKYSCFTFDFGKYKKTIAHSEHYLPELEIQSGFNNFNEFSREWDHFQYILHLTLPLNPYAQGNTQEQSNQ